MIKKKQVFTIILISSILVIVSIASLAYGTKVIPIKEVINSLFNHSPNSFNSIVIQERIPRTIFALIAGASLAVSGLLMQALTRNPVADPSILGVNSGASLFVDIGIAFFKINTPLQYISLALIGAFIVAIFVYTVANIGIGGATPIKLTLAGATTTTALISLINIIVLPRVQSLTSFRFWQVGSVSGVSWSSIAILLPFIIIGILLSILISPSLNTLSLGDEVASSLGVKLKLTRLIAALATVLLCGSITAIAGPISFVGLMIPHIMRLLFTNKVQLLIPLCAIGGAILLTLSDTIGRLIASPSEIEVGIITAFIGAPFFIYVAIITKVNAL